MTIKEKYYIKKFAADAFSDFEVPREGGLVNGLKGWFTSDPNKKFQRDIDRHIRNQRINAFVDKNIKTPLISAAVATKAKGAELRNASKNIANKMLFGKPNYSAAVRRLYDKIENSDLPAEPKLFSITGLDLIPTPPAGWIAKTRYKPSINSAKEIFDYLELKNTPRPMRDIKAQEKRLREDLLAKNEALKKDLNKTWSGIEKRINETKMPTLEEFDAISKNRKPIYKDSSRSIKDRIINLYANRNNIVPGFDKYLTYGGAALAGGAGLYGLYKLLSKNKKNKKKVKENIEE